MDNCKGRGGELFAKRSKNAYKWVIDGNQIGMGAHPSQFADEFMAQQTMAQQSVHEEKAMEIRAQQDMKDEVDAQQKAERQEFQQQQQQIFQEQQLMKQQQSSQIKQMRKPSVDLPPGFEACSLKGRPFTPSLDLSCHNVQGINVWANKGPKPYGKASSNLRTTPLSAQQPAQTKPATLAENDVEPESPKSSMAKPIPVDEQVPQFEIFPPKEEVDFEEMKSQMEQNQQVQQQQSQHIQQQQTQQVQKTQHVEQSQQVQQNQQSISAANQAQQDFELAEKKRKEYEEWLRTQEMEAYRLEYDCSVKYEEHQSEDKHEEQITSSNAHQKSERQEFQQQQQQIFQEQQLMKQQEVNRVEQPKPQPRQEPKVETKFEPKQPEPPKPIAVQPAQPPQQTKPFESQNPVQQINKPFEPVQQQQQQYQATTTQNHFQSNQSFDATDFSHSTRQQQQQQEVFQQQTSIKSHQQQQKFESHSTNFASHSSSERKEHHELKHHELNMQVKSGGILRDQQQLNDQEVEDYIGSLRPTTTGAVIRSPQPGDGIFTSAPSMESQQNTELFSQSQLKKTQREGVFGGIAGDHNSLATDAEEYERHTVRNLVQHFSKTKTGDIPLQYLPQQSMQNTGNAPPLSYLKEQAKSKDFSYKEKTETTTTSSSEHSNNVTNGKVAKKGSKDYIEDPEVRLGLFQRRGSLKDYLMMDEEKQKQESLPSIQDPSAILQVDGSVEEGLGKKRMMRDSNGRECDSQGRLIDTDKWDNHNTIARGWLTSGEDHYQPVTFRKIYNSKNQP